MEYIYKNITKFRKAKGFTYENMANELDLSIGAYRKIELNQTNLSVERLYQIAGVLDVNITQLLDIEKENYTQTNKDNATGYLQKIENFYQENKETYEKLITSKDELIKSLQEQIVLLGKK